MAQWDYSTALLLQVAAWTTLQFWWLHVAVMIALLFPERALHSALPFDAAHHCNGGNHTCVLRILRRWGWGDVDFAALVAPYVFAFHLVMWVRLVGLALLRFGAGGCNRGGPLGLGPGNNGKGSNNGGGTD